MDNQNNNFLHTCAFAVLVILLVYGGEQWSRGVDNNYMLCNLWAASTGITALVISFGVGFINQHCNNKCSMIDIDKYVYYQGSKVKRIIAPIEESENMQIESENRGRLANMSLCTHYVNIALTFLAGSCLAIVPTSFVLALIKG